MSRFTQCFTVANAIRGVLFLVERVFGARVTGIYLLEVDLNTGEEKGKIEEIPLGVGIVSQKKLSEAVEERFQRVRTEGNDKAHLFKIEIEHDISR